MERVWSCDHEHRRLFDRYAWSPPIVSLGLSRKYYIPTQISRSDSIVMPAEAGIQVCPSEVNHPRLDSRVRGNDGSRAVNRVVELIFISLQRSRKRLNPLPVPGPDETT